MNSTTNNINLNSIKNKKPKKINDKSRVNNERNNKQRFTDVENIKNKKHFNVGTLNVRGLNKMAKQQQLLNYMNLYNIDILGVQETSIPQRQSKYTCMSTKYDCYFTNDERNLGSGVGIIINKSISRYVHRVRKYKGRLIILELILKNNTKVKIINTYIPSPSPIRTKEEILELYKLINKEINESNQSQTYNIVIGDFNLNYENFVTKKKKSTIDWRFRILTQLHDKDYHDLIEIIYGPNNEKNRSLDTFIPPDNNKSPSRIDYIYASTNLLQEVFAIKNYNMELFNTDHKVVVASFFTEEIFNLKSQARLRKNSLLKEKFYYDKATEQNWSDFAESANLTITQDMNNSIDSINKKWNIIQKAIYDSAINNIPNKMITTQDYRSKFSKEINDNLFFLRKLNRMLKRFNKNKVIFMEEKLNKNWVEIDYKIMIQVAEYLELPSTPPPDTITESNFETMLNLIKVAIKLLRLKLNNTSKKETQDRIKKLVEKRCTDYKENLGIMISSLIEKNKKKIIIDRLIINENHERKLIIEDDEILSRTNLHFQTIANSKNEIKVIPEEWEDAYDEQPHINKDIYDELMDPIEIEELNHVINNISLNKATGPSKISNEMIKHLN